MEIKDFELVLEAVDKKFVRPLMLALHAVSMMACPDHDSKLRLSEILKAQLSTCPEDVEGRIYLKWLAEQLVSPASTHPSGPDKSLHASLRLVDQKKRDA